MSSLAELFVVERSDLAPLVDAARPKRRLFGRARGGGFEEKFAARAREVDAFDASGHYFGVALSYLDEEHGVSLGDAPELRDAAAAFIGSGMVTFILFDEHDARHLPKLDPAVHDEAALRHYCEEFWEEEDPGAGRAMLDAIALLGRHIGSLDDGSVLVLRVG